MNRIINAFFSAMMLNNNLWLFGTVPTQIIGILRYIFVPRHQVQIIFLILIFSLMISVQLLLGINEFIKHFLFIVGNLLFSSFLLTDDKFINDLPLTMLIMGIICFFIPEEFFKHNIIFYEYGYIPRFSLFTQNPNELSVLFLIPLLISAILSKKITKLSIYVCLTAIILSGSRIGVIVAILLLLPRLKFKNILFIFTVFFILVYFYIKFFNFDYHDFFEKKTSDIINNKRWEHLVFYIENFRGEILKNGILPSIGNVHNTFFALSGRFGIIGLVFGIIIFLLIFVFFIYDLLNKRFKNFYSKLIGILPLMFYDLTMSPYFAVWMICFLNFKRTENNDENVSS